MRNEKFAGGRLFSQFLTLHPSFLIPLFLFSVRHFADELDANETYFGLIATQFLNGRLKVICVGISEIIIDFVNSVFVHYLIEEVVNVQTCALTILPHRGSSQCSALFRYKR